MARGPPAAALPDYPRLPGRLTVDTSGIGYMRYLDAT